MCKRDLFRFIKNRVWDKLKGWNMSVFSVAGKEVLLKAVVQTIPTYAISCFKLPKTLIKDLHRLIADFWWGSKTGKSKMHWEKWNQMCNSKKRGGLGFRDLRCFNQALLAKQGWRLLRKPDSLVDKVLKACYYPSGDFLTARKGSKASFVWRSIIWGKEVIENDSRWRIGSGVNIDIIQDRWVPNPPMFKIFDPPPFPEGFSVFDIRLHNGEWDSEFILLLFGEEEARKILSLPLGSFNHDDVFIWHFSRDGEYSVKSGYKVALDAKGYVEPSNPSFSMSWWRKLWGMKLPPKVKVFGWKLCKGWLPSTNTLAHRGMNVNANCFRCGLGLETTFYAYLGM
ncbi:hypothetical protein UlMin_013464 [Ulmus minor]